MHFTVLVIGENPEKQLAPFDENLSVEFYDKTQEFQQQYEQGKTYQFYSSNSIIITKELFDELKNSKVGRVAIIDIKEDKPKLNDKFKTYCILENGIISKNYSWFEVDEVLTNDKFLIRKIAAPKKMSIKDKYPKYEDYLKYWHNIDDTNQQGYYFNPQAKWNWYQLGGRWTGFFILKPHAKGVIGEYSFVSDRRAKYGTADQAYKKDIDFDAMRQKAFEVSSKNYDEFEKARQSENFDPITYYFKFGIENTSKNPKKYIPQTREEYIKKHSHISTFAILKDGKWDEKNGKSDDIWYQKFDKLLDKLQDDTLLSLFDCHI